MIFSGWRLCLPAYVSHICIVSDRLPGPPQNVHIELIDAHSVRVRWDPPVKNPNTVELYR
jgi:hypothetical protein